MEDIGRLVILSFALYGCLSMARDFDAWTDERRSKSAAVRCGCQACKAVAHSSDCAVHNGPALPVGACNCGALGSLPLK